MYDALRFATSIVLIKIEFMIMIIKFICSFFSKDIIKIAFNAVFLLLFDFGCLLVFNTNGVDNAFIFTMFLCMYFVIIIFDSGNIIRIFGPDKTVDNNNIKLQKIKKLKKNDQSNQEDFTHIPIGKTIKTRNIIHME